METGSIRDKIKSIADKICENPDGLTLDNLISDLANTGRDGFDYICDIINTIEDSYIKCHFLDVIDRIESITLTDKITFFRRELYKHIHKPSIYERQLRYFIDENLKILDEK